MSATGPETQAVGAQARVAGCRVTRVTLLGGTERTLAQKQGHPDGRVTAPWEISGMRNAEAGSERTMVHLATAVAPALFPRQVGFPAHLRPGSTSSLTA